jgi:hypothetical protein
MFHYGGKFDGEGFGQFADCRTGSLREPVQDCASRRITQRCKGAIQVTVFHHGKY